MEASTPTRSNSIDLFDSRSILTCKFYLALNDETKQNSSYDFETHFSEFFQIPSIVFVRIMTRKICARYVRDSLGAYAYKSPGVNCLRNHDKAQSA